MAEDAVRRIDPFSAIIDLTCSIEEDMVANHPYHPRAPFVWQHERHEFTQWWYKELWDSDDGEFPLWGGLPEEARQGGKGHGSQDESCLLGTHMGTHIDAATHYDNRSSQDAAAIPLHRAFGSALMLDLRDVCVDGNHAITVDELTQAERATGDRLHEDDIAILHTGHMARYGTGPHATREAWATRYSGLARSAGGWFIERRVKLVGIDGPNLDCDLATVAHVNFLLRGWVGQEPILVVENLANLEAVPRARFTFTALPLPIVGAGGSPVRAVALV